MRFSLSNAESWRRWLLFVVAAAAVAILFAAGEIRQPPSYHSFADRRTLGNIPNFWNVASNLAFVLVGICGLIKVRHRGTDVPHPAPAVFFGAVALVGPGSVWYHLRPGDATLFWDRLPMAVVFTAFLAMVIARHVSPDTGRRALLPLLTAGVASVIWWRLTGDLRPYILVQFLPLLLVPVIMLIYPLRRSAATGWVWAALGAYAVAKGFELGDAMLYRMIGIGGHTLKHLVAALGAWYVALSLTVSDCPRAANRVSNREG